MLLARQEMFSLPKGWVWLARQEMFFLPEGWVWLSRQEMFSLPEHLRGRCIKLDRGCFPFLSS